MYEDLLAREVKIVLFVLYGLFWRCGSARIDHGLNNCTSYLMELQPGVEASGQTGNDPPSQ